MSTDRLEEPDEQGNRVLDIFGEFLRLLIRKHRVAPEVVAKAAIGSAVMLFLEYNTMDERAAATTYIVSRGRLRGGVLQQSNRTRYGR
jgi:hypothetical protein